MSAAAPFECVTDASVAVKLFIVEPLSDRAHMLFARLAADPPARFYVPDLFFAECANILWKYVWRFGYPADDARRNLADLTALPLRIVSTAELVEEALDIALAQSMSAYDACYAALAHRLGLPLVTADETLVHKLASTPYVAYSLASFPP